MTMMVTVIPKILVLVNMVMIMVMAIMTKIYCGK